MRSWSAMREQHARDTVSTRLTGLALWLFQEGRCRSYEQYPRCYASDRDTPAQHRHELFARGASRGCTFRHPVSAESIHHLSSQHLEDAFAKPRANLTRILLTFKPYVSTASYYNFLRGTYFDSCTRLPGAPSRLEKATDSNDLCQALKSSRAGRREKSTTSRSSRQFPLATSSMLLSLLRHLRSSIFRPRPLDRKSSMKRPSRRRRSASAVAATIPATVPFLTSTRSFSPPDPASSPSPSSSTMPTASQRSPSLPLLGPSATSAFGSLSGTSAPPSRSTRISSRHSHSSTSRRPTSVCKRTSRRSSGVILHSSISSLTMSTSLASLVEIGIKAANAATTWAR